MARSRRSPEPDFENVDPTPPTRPTPRGIPVLNLAPRFIPPGDPTGEKTEDFLTFSEIIELAEAETSRKRESELKAGLRAFKKAMRAAAPGKPEVEEILKKYFSGVGTKTKAGKPDPLDTAKEHWHETSRFLHSTLESGDKDAIKFLYETARTSTMLLHMVSKIHPETVRGISRKQWGMPVIATGDTAWIARARTDLKRLELGQDPSPLRSRFRETTGEDRNHTARGWAKEAVRTLEDTYWRILVFSHFSSPLSALVESGRIEFQTDPEWFHRFPPYQPFSKGTVKQWSDLVRSLIRESVPDLHLRREWKDIRRSLKSRELGTEGRVRNEILTRITRTLKTFAPDPP